MDGSGHLFDPCWHDDDEILEELEQAVQKEEDEVYESS